MTPMGIVWALLALGVLIFVHELGHFLFAKLFGVTVEKFSLGFGPKIIGKKVGETEYLISAFPLGGYVKMLGEGDEEQVSPEDRNRTFAGKTPLQRIIIVAAGPVFNLLFAFILYVGIFSAGFPVDAAKVGKVVEGKPAAAAGIKGGDVVVSIDGKKIASWNDMQKEIFESNGRPVAVTVVRDGRELSFTVKPVLLTDKNLLGDTVTVPIIGIESAGQKILQRYNPLEALVNAGKQTLLLIKLTYVVLGKLVQRAIPLDTIGGPIMIAKMAGDQAAEGGSTFFAFLALLSVNLGVLNLLPVPILDGGHIVFNLWELIFRRPVTAKAREVAQQIGLVLLLALMFLAFYNDIARYFLKQG